ncbi:MAG: glycosyltransferase [Kastovskya adunca ATA6-11-RM4]|jgi:colanic acid/amylovoran biosynthesis glycosyltransferase|nr:glycosyltransferase [Kastovskya adunca ATA6-11-RM4]
MKVAFIVGRFPVLSEAFILNQITGLIDRGHEVDIYALEGPSGEDRMHPSVEKYGLLDRVHYTPQAPVNYLWRVLKGLWLLVTNFYKNPVACGRSLNVFKYGKQALSLRLLYGVIPALGTQPYDIIHCQFGFYALRGKLIEDVGALTLHELGVLRGKFITSFRGFDISWYVQKHGDRVYDQLFERGHFYLTNCEFFRRRAISIGCDPKKIVVLGSGIDCSRFAFSPRRLPADGRIRIATTGRLVEKKGIEYGIRAVAKLAKDYPNIEYNIIGDGYLREPFEQLIQELGMGDIIKLLGWKQQQEIVEVLKNSQIFVATSVTANNGNQDAPVNTLKEAMAMGMPVVASRHGGIPELVKDGVSGFLVPERDAEAIAKKLLYLIDHPEIWLAMGKAGRACAEARYDMHKLNDELVEIYQHVLTEKATVSAVNYRDVLKIGPNLT